MSDYLKRGIVTSYFQNIENKNNRLTVKDTKKNILSCIVGEYMSYVNFDGKSYLNIERKELPTFERPAYVLPSDSLFREDKNNMIRKDIEMGQKAKDELERIQRNDRNIRSE